MTSKSDGFFTEAKRDLKSLNKGASTWVRKIISHPHKDPIFVLGNQKSGTSAIASLLAKVADCSVTIDLREEIKTPTFQLVRKGDLSFDKFIWINKLDFTKKIVKEPNLSIFYDELLLRFPDAKFVFVVRDPRDNIRSILNRLKVPGNLETLNEEDFPEISHAWSLILKGEWLGLEGNNYIDFLANRWNYLNEIYLHNQNNIALIRYEDFRNNKLEALKELALELDLTADSDITQWLDYQFQPRGAHDISWHDFFGLNLEKIERICAIKMRELGYSTVCLDTNSSQGTTQTKSIL